MAHRWDVAIAGGAEGEVTQMHAAPIITITTTEQVPDIPNDPLSRSTSPHSNPPHHKTDTATPPTCRIIIHYVIQVTVVNDVMGVAIFMHAVMHKGILNADKAVEISRVRSSLPHITGDPLPPSSLVITPPAFLILMHTTHNIMRIPPLTTTLSPKTGVVSTALVTLTSCGISH